MQSTTQLRTAGVDLGGLMTVLSRHLYSTPTVALRELVQNSHDSIIRRRIETHNPQDSARITVIGNLAKRTITVIDNGAGLTEDEIHTYLATVGVGYTRRLREQNNADDALIGMFGLGFLSAFVLASRVTVTSTSYQTPTLGWRYRSNNAEQYQVDSVPAREEIGTEVLLELRDDFGFLAAYGQLEAVLGRYCALLKAPLFINDANQALNQQAPPWRQTGTVIDHPVQRQRYLLDFATKFEKTFEPICVMPVLADAQSDVQGLLWVQDGGTYGTSDNRNLSVFVRGMLLDDEARDLLPVWAGFIGGVIESNRLTPTASREDLQRDDAYKDCQRVLEQSLVRGLAQIAQSQPEAWRRVLTRHNESLLGAALCSESLFDFLADQVRLPTSQGELKAAALPSGGRVHVSMGGSGGFEDMLFRAMRVPVARGDRYAVLPFLRQWAARQSFSLLQLGTEGGDAKWFQAAELPDAEMEWLKQSLADGEYVVAAHFAPAELPLIVVPDREAELKRRLDSDAADKRIASSLLRLARAHTAQINGQIVSRLYINLDNPTVLALLNAYRAGHGTTAAVRLLRAVKTLLSAGSEHDGAVGDLNGALTQIGLAAQQLLVAAK